MAPSRHLQTSTSKKMAAMITKLCLLLATAVAANASCYADEADPYFFFGTKTSNKFIRNDNTDPINLPGCTPVQMWLFNRHGTRYPRNDVPTEPEIDNMAAILPRLRDDIIANHQAGRGSLCDADLTNLRDWVLEYTLDEEEKLAPAGEEELHDLAQRYQTRLPQLLDHDYDPNLFELRFTTASRTEKSCKHFAIGLFGKDQEDTIYYPTPVAGDPVLRFDKNCTKWLNEVDGNPDAQYEKTLFRLGTEVNKTIEDVSIRLGFRTVLSIDDVFLAYTMCRYDKAIHFKRLSPWCALFSRSDLAVFEYIEDLDSFYKESYGHDINWLQACKPVTDLVNRFTRIASGIDRSPYGVFYFSHEGTLGKIMTRLGLFQDPEPLRADNFVWNIGRNWRTSRILPFASNLVFVLFRCELDTYKIQLYVNERPVPIPGCSDAEACPFSEFVHMMRPVIETCDLDVICQNHF